jgi:DMSO reductase anchor subunit
MHPAYSVILFTTASGAGYGLLALASLLALLGVIPPERWLGFAIFGIAFGLVTLGLLSSIWEGQSGHGAHFLNGAAPGFRARAS